MRKWIDSYLSLLMLVTFVFTLSVTLFLSEVHKSINDEDVETVLIANKSVQEDIYSMPETNLLHIEYSNLKEQNTDVVLALNKKISVSLKEMIDSSQEDFIVDNFEQEPVYYNIDLSKKLQEHTYKLSKEYKVDMELVLAIMWHESRFIEDVDDNINTNGSHDRGLMQINEVNWGWLSDKGLDVNNPYDNIESGVLMLSMLTEKYDLEKTLMAYQCGEGRMKELVSKGYVTDFVYDIMEISKGFEKL